MSMAESFLSMSENLVGRGINAAQDKVADHTENRIDNTMQNGWQNSGVTNYDSDNYERFIVESRSDAQAYRDKLDEFGIEYQTAHIGGQTVFEISDQIDQSQCTNSYQEFMQEHNGDNNSYNSNFISADVLRSCMDSELNVSTADYNGREHSVQGEFSTAKGDATELGRNYISNFDELGAAINKVYSLYQEAKSYGLIQTDVLGVDKYGDQVAHKSGKSKEATLVYNDKGMPVVLIDGKITENKQVINDYHERAKAAESQSHSFFAAVRERAHNIQDEINGGVTETATNAQKYSVTGIGQMKSRSGWDRQTDKLNEGISFGKISMKSMTFTSDDLEILKSFRTAKDMGLESEQTAINRALNSQDPSKQFNSCRMNYSERNQLYIRTRSVISQKDSEIRALQRENSSLDPTSLKFKENELKIKDLADEKNQLESLAQKLKLSTNEQEQYDKSMKQLDKLNKDLGLKIGADGYISRSDLMDINRAFLNQAAAAGYDLAGFAGVDIHKLKKLSAEDLKKIGISKSTLNFLIAINGTSMFNSGIRDELKGDLKSLLKAFSKLEDSDDWASFEQDLRLAEKIAKHTARVTRVSYKLTKVVTMPIRKGISVSGKALKKKIEKNDKVKKLKEKVTDRRKGVKKGEVDKKRIDKAMKRQDRLDKLHKFNQRYNPIVRIKNLKDEIRKKLLKMGLSAAKYLVIGVLPLTGFVVIVFAVLASISSMIHKGFTAVDEALAPSDYTETASYCLYAYLEGKETEWLDTVLNYYPQGTVAPNGGAIGNNSDEAAKRAMMFEGFSELKYGINYQSFRDYIGSNFANKLDYTIDENGKYTMYINPFSASNGQNATVKIVHGSDNGVDTATISGDEKYLTKVKSYDGVHDFSIAANSNMYNRLSPQSANGNQNLCIENGHTKNAKDILAMVDVLYQFSIQDMNDDYGLYSILGRSPAQIDWENQYNGFLSTVKWLWTNAKNFCKHLYNFYIGHNWTDEFVLVDRSVFINGGTTSYQAIQNYITAVFDASHQQSISLDTEFYPVVKDKLALNALENGNVVDDVVYDQNDPTGSNHLINVNTFNSFFDEENHTSKFQQYNDAPDSEKSKVKRELMTSLTQAQASELGYCIDPKKEPFVIQRLESGKISPIYDGRRADTLESGGHNFDAVVEWENRCTYHVSPDSEREDIELATDIPYGAEDTIEHHYSDIPSEEHGKIHSEVCINERFLPNAATYEWLENYLEKCEEHNAYSCWEKEDPESVHKYHYYSNSEYSSEYDVNGDAPGTVTSNYFTDEAAANRAGYYATEREARTAAENRLRELYDDYINSTPLPNDEFWVNNHRTGYSNENSDVFAFTRYNYENPEFEPVLSDFEVTRVHDHDDYVIRMCLSNGAISDRSRQDFGEGDPNNIAAAPPAIQSDAAAWLEGNHGDTSEVWVHKNLNIGSHYNASQAMAAGAANTTFTADNGCTARAAGYNVTEADVGMVEWYWIDFDSHKHYVREYFYHSEPEEVTVEFMRFKGKVNVLEKFKTQYERNCRGHYFMYCGGHVGFHSQGIVYSITNEQLTLSGIYNQSKKPISLGYNLKDNGYDKLKGKHDRSTLVRGTLAELTSTGTVKSPVEDPQGSFIGSSSGLELWTDGNAWLEGEDVVIDNEGHTTREKQCIKPHDNFLSQYQLDIFDCDTAMLKACNVLPIKDNDPRNFEGWTADNIQLCCLKFAADWTEIYGFDIPWEITSRKNFLNYGAALTYDSEEEARSDAAFTQPCEGGWEWFSDQVCEGRSLLEIGASAIAKRRLAAQSNRPYNEPGGVKVENGYTLIPSDINEILNNIEGHDSLSSGQRKMLKSTLEWVGRGHFSSKHTDHNFLESACVSHPGIEVGDQGHPLSRAGNCTASDSIGFVKYIYAMYGYDTNGGQWVSSSGGNPMPSQNCSNLRPGDAVIHGGVYDANGNPDVLHVVETTKLNSSEQASRGEENYYIEQIQRSAKNEGLIYIGTLENDVTLYSPSFGYGMELDVRSFPQTRGWTLPAGSILSVSLTSCGDVGTVWLHVDTPDQTHSMFDYSPSCAPYWLLSPDYSYTFHDSGRITRGRSRTWIIRFNQ